MQSLVSSTQGSEGKLSLELKTDSFDVFQKHAEVGCNGTFQDHGGQLEVPILGEIQGSWITLLQFSAAVGQPCQISPHIFLFSD